MRVCKLFLDSTAFDAMNNVNFISMKTRHNCITRLILQLMLPGAHTTTCCDSVRSPLHDSLGPHSLCPCQLDRVLQHRVSTMPVNLLPRPSFNEAGFTIGATDLSAFYSPLVSSLKFTVRFLN